MNKKIIILFALVCLVLSVSITASSGEHVPITYDPGNTIGAILSNDNYTVATGYSASQGTLATEHKTSGKWYYEVTVDKKQGNGCYIGVANHVEPVNVSNFGTFIAYKADGKIYNRGINNVTSVATFDVGDIIGVALDADNKIVEFYKNGKKQGESYNTSSFPKITAAILSNSNGSLTSTTNFGLKPFVYNIPEGYAPYDSVYQEPIPEPAKLFVVLTEDEEMMLSVRNNQSDNSNYTWTSDDSSIVSFHSVTDGMMKGESVGTTTVWVKNSDGTFKDCINVKVVEAEMIDEERLTIDLEAGRESLLYLSDEPDIIWSSMDSSRLAVEQDGKIKALMQGGPVLVTAELNGMIHSIYVRIR